MIDFLFPIVLFLLKVRRLPPNWRAGAPSWSWPSRSGSGSRRRAMLFSATAPGGRPRWLGELVSKMKDGSECIEVHME